MLAERMLGCLCFTSLNQSRIAPNICRACYFEALTHSSRNHGVEGVAGKGRPKGRRDALLFNSFLLVFAAVLPKSINCCGGCVAGGRIPASKRARLFLFSVCPRGGEGEQIRG